MNITNINAIQQKIKEMEGGAFQKFFDAYLVKKYKYSNIHSPGIQSGTNKTIKGVPDSYVETLDGKYILIMAGTHKKGYKKIKEDIESCLDEAKTGIKISQIQKIICGYTSNEISLKDHNNLKNEFAHVEIELIGISEISNDIYSREDLRILAKDYLNINIGTNQVLSISDFLTIYDRNNMSSPLNTKLVHREKEIEEIENSVSDFSVTIVTGSAGVGKTKLVLETCKILEQNKWKVICIKNNGQALLDDLRGNLISGKDLILFIDDADEIKELEKLFSYLVTIRESYQIRIILTIRDYVSKEIETITNKHFDYNEIKINPLSNDAINDLLKINYEIRNNQYLKVITNIARGNSRIAVLSALVFSRNEKTRFKSIIDVFKCYYEEILDRLKGSEDYIVTLFIISLFGPLRISDSGAALTILEFLHISVDSFVEKCKDLNEKKLIDLYSGEIAIINDQCFANYILVYALFEKEFIKMSQLLELCFSKYRTKIIYAINTLLCVFLDEKLNKSIKKEIQIAWNKAEAKGEANNYLETFYSFNLEKSIEIINEQINEEKPILFDLNTIDFSLINSNQMISDSKILVLSDFKYAEDVCFKASVELLMNYFKKRPDLFREFYVAFAINMGLDSKSAINKYDREKDLLETIWKSANNGENYNESILFIFVSRQFLNCEVDKIEKAGDRSKIYYIKFHFEIDEELKAMRTQILKKLSLLYRDSRYERHLNKLFLSLPWFNHKKDEAKQLFKEDLEFLMSNIFKLIEEPTFNQCRVLFELKKYGERFNLTGIKLEPKYYKNEQYNLYRRFVLEQSSNNAIEKTQEKIRKHLKDYREQDYDDLFKICKSIEAEEKGLWRLRMGINLVFSVNQQKTIYPNIVRLYLKNGCPLNLSPSKILANLFINFQLPLKSIYELITAYDFPSKREWVKVMWEMMPGVCLDEQGNKLFLKYIKEECKNSNPLFPDAIYLERYVKQNKELLKSISMKLKKSNKEAIQKFLGFGADAKEASYIVNLFYKNIQNLEELYLLSMSEEFDNEGFVLFEIIKNDKIFWNLYIKSLAKNKSDIYIDKILSEIWCFDDYSYYVDTVFKEMIEKNEKYYNYEPVAKALFENKKNNEKIKEKKKEWICNYFVKNIKNIEKLNRVISVIDYVAPEMKIECVLKFIHLNDNIGDFKKLHLINLPIAFFESEVPIIDSKIEFLQSLNAEIHETKLFAHKIFLEKNIFDLEQQKKEIEKTEFLYKESK